MSDTKKVRITLAAFTRVEYNEVLVVPANITDEELDALVEQRYDSVDGGEFSDDPEYWERAPSTGHEVVDDDETPDEGKKVFRNAEGEIVIEIK